ncbi:hypothetical protein TIFTF001_002489 [Ficus carica]|uniref:Uncharacterized protein n=1 Tax=Ficus carica TaxID=3494 RepID=A0AA87Z504_FICCA|nr:hypothetical protein TIFTF001_002489 [Ficus carica]
MLRPKAHKIFSQEFHYGQTKAQPRQNPNHPSHADQPKRPTTDFDKQQSGHHSKSRFRNPNFDSGQQELCPYQRHRIFEAPYGCTKLQPLFLSYGGKSGAQRRRSKSNAPSAGSHEQLLPNPLAAAVGRDLGQNVVVASLDQPPRRLRHFEDSEGQRQRRTRGSSKHHPPSEAEGEVAEEVVGEVAEVEAEVDADLGEGGEEASGGWARDFGRVDWADHEGEPYGEAGDAPAGHDDGVRWAQAHYEAAEEEDDGGRTMV